MRLASLFAWLKRKWTRPRAPIAVHLYTRQGCHLCTAAREQIARIHERYPLTFTQTDVDTDADLAARFGAWVPVLVVNGKVRFRGTVNPVLLERLFRAEARRA
jgi:hypothetical protein